MNILKRFLITCLLSLILQNTLSSQPRISLIVQGGYTAPLGNFKLDVPFVDTVREDWPYQTKSAYHIGAVGVFAVDKHRKINLAFGLNYTSFSNNVQILNTSTSNAGNNFDGGISGVNTITFKPKINLITVNLGVIYKFSPDEKFNPMLSVDATGNFFSGDFSFDGTSSGIYTTTNLNSAFRLGFQLGGALEYRINKNFGLIGGLKYNLTNIFGKSSESSQLTTSIDLGDKEHSLYGVTRSSRSISYVQISIGAVLYFKRPETSNSPGK